MIDKHSTLDIRSIDYFEETDATYLDAQAEVLYRNFPPIDEYAQVVVTIPAHNEADYILSCLEALYQQRCLSNYRLSTNLYEVIVACHNCTDDTFARCKAFHEQYPSFKLFLVVINDPRVNNVGAVRRIAMHLACQRLVSNRGLIAMTDADTCVDAHWIAHLLQHIPNSYDLICGKIKVDVAGLTEQAKQTIRYKELYQQAKLSLEWRFSHKKPHYTMAAHSDNSGPNLAVRKAVYQQIGGLQPLGFCEDVAFYDQVIYNGYTVHHCSHMVVTTSSRVETRAPWGFGAELNTWQQEDPVEFRVASLAELLHWAQINQLLSEYLTTPTPRGLEALKERTALGARVSLILQQFTTPTAVVHKFRKELEADVEWQQRYPKEAVAAAYYKIQHYLEELD
jgi:GT2 family glycosyltransferase